MTNDDWPWGRMIGKWGPVSKRQRRGRMNRRKWERRWKRMRISSVGW